MKYVVDKIDPTFVKGWCFDESNICAPIILELYVNNKKVTEEIANKKRKDLFEKEIHPTGLAGFVFSMEKAPINNNSKIEIRVKGGDYTLNLDKAYGSFLDELMTTTMFSNAVFDKRKLCIVHIGMHKTGSSSIQHNLNKTKNENFSYFNLGTENHSIPLYSMFSENRNSYHIHKSLGRDESDIYAYNLNVDKMFKKHIYNNLNQSTFVISGEDISVLTLAELRKFQRYLLNYFETIKVVAYVRPPFSYINSALQQRIKDGLGDFELATRQLYPYYENKFGKFDVVFGKKNVSLNYFSKGSLVENDVTKDFIYRNNLKVKKKKFDSTNKSMSLEAISLLYIYNKLAQKPIASPRGSKAKQNLINILQNVGSKKFLISKKSLTPIITDHNEDIRWIERRINKKVIEEDTYNDSDEVIECEEDIFEAAKPVTNELRTIISEKTVTTNTTGDSPKDMAKLMEMLYQKLY